MEQMQNRLQSAFSPLSFDNAQATHCVRTCLRTREENHTLILTLHFVKCCVLYIKFWIKKKKQPTTQKILVKIFYILFYQTCQTPHGFRCGCGYLQMTHHRWPGSPGTQGWTVQGGAGGPSPCKETFHGSRSHPWIASAKASASCWAESGVFQNWVLSSVFEARSELNQADKN